MSDYAVYPYQFKDSTPKMDLDTCFIIMPFNNTAEVYKTIQKAIEDCNLKYDRSDSVTTSIPFIHKIINSISKANFLIVDISGNNANVLYELGIAHTLRDMRRVLILKDKETRCPSDLHHITYFEYDKNSLNTLYNHVTNFLQTNNYTSDLMEIMLLLDIIDNSIKSYEAIKIIKDELKNQCFELIYMLNNKFKDVDEAQANMVLISLYNVLSQSLRTNDTYKTYLKLICIVLRKIPVEYNMRIFTDYIFQGLVFDDEDEQEFYSIVVEIAVELLKFEKNSKSLYDWIKLFLSKSSPASVSISRYKLIVGFINSKSNISKKFLLSILNTGNNSTLIEHAINLCRARNIKESVDFALNIISTTNNPYVFRSAIDLITDLGENSHIEEMFKSFAKKEDFINNNDFIKVHINRTKIKRTN